MDFNDTPEQAAFRAQVRAWLAETAPRHEVPPGKDFGNVSSREELEFAKTWQAAKADAGYAVMHWPQNFGGRDLPRIYTVIYNEEESRYRVPRGAFFNIGINFGGPTVIEYGSTELRERLLPRLRRADDVWCQLFSEPGAGSDLAGLRTRAVRDGDEWVINGQKIWSTYAQYADWGILVTRHDPSLPKHKGLTYFLLDMKSHGVEVRPIKQASGASHFNEVFFTNVRIPDSYRLGEVGDGWQVAITTLMNERLGANSAEAPPTFKNVLELVRDVATETGPAIDDPSVRERMADWYVKFRGLELVQQRSLTRLAQGRQPGPESSIRKLVAGDLQQEIASFGMDLCEMHGTRLDAAAGHGSLFGRALMSCPATRIAGGTDEILRNILAERVLGLPGDIRVDRDVAFRDIPTGRS
jgi:acyl-CoA dehydrogenase